MAAMNNANARFLRTKFKYHMQYRSAQWEDLMKNKTYLTFFLIAIASLASAFIPQAALPAGGGMMGGGMMGGPGGGTIDGGSQIHEAAKLGDLEKVQTLLKNNPELVSSKDSKGNTPLHVAASSGYAGTRDVAELLLKNKADVNARNNEGATPLHEAAMWGDKLVVGLLLANKAEINAKDSKGNTPLHIALQHGQKDMAEFLRQHGAHE
jgi:hypothetical protein